MSVMIGSNSSIDEVYELIRPLAERDPWNVLDTHTHNTINEQHSMKVVVWLKHQIKSILRPNNSCVTDFWVCDFTWINIQPLHNLLCWLCSSWLYLFSVAIMVSSHNHMGNLSIRKYTSFIIITLTFTLKCKRENTLFIYPLSLKIKWSMPLK